MQRWVVRGRGPLGAGLLGLVVGVGGTLAALEGGVGPFASSHAPVERAAARLGDVLEGRDPVERAAGVARIFDGLAATAASVDVIRPVVESAPIHDGDPELALLAAWWASRDPEAAYHWSQRSPRGASLRVLAAVFEAWGTRDAGAAVQHAEQEATPERRERAHAALLLGLDRAPDDGPRELARILSRMQRRPERRRALEGLAARRLTTAEPREVLAWARRTGRVAESPEVAADALWGAAVAVAAADPELAAKAVWAGDPELAAKAVSAPGRTGTPPPPVLVEIAERWADGDPESALEWLASFEPGQARSEGVRWAFRTWLMADRDAAMAWAATRVDDPASWLDPVRANYGFVVGHSDPRAGLDVLFRLPVGEERARRVQTVFAKWRARDPADAGAWLAEADLPSSRKQELGRVRPPKGFSRSRSAPAEAAEGAGAKTGEGEGG